MWTGHHIYITDQNHGYEDVDLPISRQAQPERAVRGRRRLVAGARHGGAARGAHRAPRRGGAGSVVTGPLPDFCVAAGAPARPIRRYDPEGGWQTVPGQTG